MDQQILVSPPCEIRTFGSAKELVGAVAQDWMEFLQMMSLGGREPTVALSGGRIARTFFEESTRLLGEEPDLAQKAHYFWADERCVPPNHAESNFRLAADQFLAPLNVPETHIHRVPGEFEPQLGADVAYKALLKWTGTDLYDIPAINLVLLGMGEDGHVASLFPGDPPEPMGSHICYRPVVGPKPPPNRVTMSYALLANAEEVWVLASGAGKDLALKDALAASESPLAKVLRSRSNTRIYTDLRPE